MKAHITEAIKPYVKQVLSISIGKWRISEENNDENTVNYLNGKYDGNYVVQFEPLDGIGIPQFIPVGKKLVQAQVEYLKGGLNFERECNNCFMRGHMRSDMEVCQGAVGWIQHATKLRQEGIRLRQEAGDIITLSEEEQMVCLLYTSDAADE